jgi:protocatechuate 4,5-dioxygenase, alpha chain
MLIHGAAPFTGERSRAGYRLNKLASSLTDPKNREAFLADEAGYMVRFGLSAEEQDRVRRRDWAAMLEHGGNIYVVLKIAGTVGHTLMQMGAQMRGQPLEAFMATLQGKPGGH